MTGRVRPPVLRRADRSISPLRRSCSQPPQWRQERHWLVCDPADGERYRFKKMADGKLWFLENFRARIEGSRCVDARDQAKAAGCLGRLYNWLSAEQCAPPGWRLPSYQDWSGLRAAYNGNWSAIDQDGFGTELTHACYHDCNGPEAYFRYKSARSHFWTSSPHCDRSIVHPLDFILPQSKRTVADHRLMVMFGMDSPFPHSVLKHELASIRYVREG